MPINNPNIDNSNANPPFGGAAPNTWPRMTSVGAAGFQPVMNGYNRTANATWPDEVGIDEGGDGTGPGIGLNQWASVYSRSYDAGTFSLNELNLGGGNMYGWFGMARYDFPLLKNVFGKRGELFGHVTAELLDPGDYYTSDTVAYFLRWEVTARF